MIVVIEDIEAESSEYVGSESAEVIEVTVTGVGPQGPPGEPGMQGSDGVDGASAYEVAVIDGFVGSESDWLDSLVGPGGASTLDDLSDVDTAGATDGQALTFDADTSEWVPATVGGGGGGPVSAEDVTVDAGQLTTLATLAAQAELGFDNQQDFDAVLDAFAGFALPILTKMLPFDPSSLQAPSLFFASEGTAPTEDRQFMALVLDDDVALTSMDSGAEATGPRVRVWMVTEDATGGHTLTWPEDVVELGPVDHDPTPGGHSMFLAVHDFDNVWMLRRIWPAPTGGAAEWGSIGGTLGDQTDLAAALDLRAEGRRYDGSDYVPGVRVFTGSTDPADEGFTSQPGDIWIDDDPAPLPEGSGVPTSRVVSAGTGLTGGGDLSADRTLSVDFGTGAGEVAEGNDSRLSDARTPTAHAASHASDGSDALALNASQVTAGQFAVARVASGTATDGHVPTVTGGALVLAAPSGGGAVDSVNGQTGVVVLDAGDVGAATAAQGSAADTAVQPGALAGYVPTSRTINGDPLTANVTLDAADVGAVPTSRTVNAKALSANITLDAADVNADPEGTAADEVAALDELTDGVRTTLNTSVPGFLAIDFDGANVQDFTSNGTWTKPDGVTVVAVLAMGGSGGGGSGRKGAEGTDRYGGGGSSAAPAFIGYFPASAFGASESVTVGQGGAGAPARSTNNQDGANGTAGTASSIGSVLSVPGGTGGFGGSATSSSGGSASPSMHPVGLGGAGAAGATGSVGGLSTTGGTVGFSGGGSGGVGRSAANANTLLSGGGGAGVGAAAPNGVATGNGNNGNAGAIGRGGSGGSGGHAGGNGGNGGFPGGGAGGGGSGINDGANSGAGGNGANGYVRIVSW